MDTIMNQSTSDSEFFYISLIDTWTFLYLCQNPRFGPYLSCLCTSASNIYINININY